MKGVLKGSVILSYVLESLFPSLMVNNSQKYTEGILQ